MTNKTIIFGSAIAIALVAGIVSSGMLAEATPATKDVFVTNDANSVIPVTGLVSTSSLPPAVSGFILGNFAGCENIATSTIFQTNIDGSGTLDTFGSFGLGENTQYIESMLQAIPSH